MNHPEIEADAAAFIREGHFSQRTIRICFIAPLLSLCLFTMVIAVKSMAEDEPPLLAAVQWLGVFITTFCLMAQVADDADPIDDGPRVPVLLGFLGLPIH